jgi:DNA-directed RNA polymerase specialized sigma24 family protein
VIDRGQLDRWMARAADGERAAIDPLFGALWPVIVDYTRRLVGDPTLAEDVAQDTLVQLFAQLARYDRSRDALAWALTLATWQCRTARKRITRRGETAEAVPIQAVDGHAVAEERELVRSALATLVTLGPRDIEIIVASITDDEALRASIAPATFRKRLERALARFRLSWRSRHGAL